LTFFFGDGLSSDESLSPSLESSLVEVLLPLLLLLSLLLSLDDEEDLFDADDELLFELLELESDEFPSSFSAFDFFFVLPIGICFN
jgi:hypothetical protein